MEGNYQDSAYTLQYRVQQELKKGKTSKKLKTNLEKMDIRWKKQNNSTRVLDIPYVLVQMDKGIRTGVM